MPLYQQDSNNSNKQVPTSNTPGGKARFSYAECPSATVVTKRPSYVTVNQSGSYAFLYDTTASYGATDELGGYITGSIQTAGGGPIRLDINPIAWRRTDGTDAAGAVTFVYVRVA